MFMKTNKNTTTENSNTTAGSKKLTPSVLSLGTHILGNIISDGAVDIDGTLEGNVKSEHITIRANGKISGDIIAHSVNIYGEVRGVIRAHEVHIYATANISGVIVHHTLTVEEGALIDAKLKRSTDNMNYRFEAEYEQDENNTGVIESAPAFVGNATLRLIG